MILPRPLAITALCACILLGSCGNSLGDRAFTGAVIGGSIGAIAGSAAGGNPVVGALIGIGVGAAAGALTDQSDIDLNNL